MALFFKRLARVAPIPFAQAFPGHSKSNFNNFRVPFGAIAAFSGGISYYYYCSSSAVVHLDEPKEDKGPKTVDWHTQGTGVYRKVYKF